MGLVLARPAVPMKTLRALVRDFYEGATVRSRFSCLDKADLLAFEEADLARVGDVAVLMSELIVAELAPPLPEEPPPDAWVKLVETSTSLLVTFVDTVADVQWFQLYREGELQASETWDEESGRTLWRRADAPSYIVPGSRGENEREWFDLVEGFLGRSYSELSSQRAAWERWALM